MPCSSGVVPLSCEWVNNVEAQLTKGSAKRGEEDALLLECCLYGHGHCCL